jgi:Domain of unknown function (DUF4349)
MVRTAGLTLALMLLAACTEQARKTVDSRPVADVPVAPAYAASAGYAQRQAPAIQSEARLTLVRRGGRSLPMRRMIARSAQVRVVVADPAAVARSLGSQVDAAGGYISDSKEWRSGGQMLASLTIRVPVDKLEPTLNVIRHAAIRVESENLSGDDVTEEYTDLGAQLTNLRVTETELRALLGTVRERTHKAADIMEVFNQLTEVRGQIDQVQARITTLDKLADLATINLDLVPDALTQPLTTAAWHPTAAVRAAFRTLLGTLKALFDGTVWVLVYILPILLLLTAPALGIWGVVRAIRRRIVPGGGAVGSTA